MSSVFHVKLPRATPKRPAGSAHDADSSARARPETEKRTPRMSATSYETEFHARNPVHLPITPSAVMEEWVKHPAAATGSFNEHGWSSSDFYFNMAARNYLTPPDYVLALTNGTAVSDILAIASVYVRASGVAPAFLDINGLTTKPAADLSSGIAPAFLRKILRWANTKTQTVFLPRTEEVDAYYRSPGIDLADDAVSEEALSRGEPAHRQDLSLVTLDSGATPPTNIDF